MSNPSKPRTGLYIKSNIYVAAIIVVLSLLYYFLSGNSLKYSGSDIINMPEPESSIVQLTHDNVYSQKFVCSSDTLSSVSVKWTTNGHINYGTACMELYNIETSELLMQKYFDVNLLIDNDVITMASDYPLENMKNVPLEIRLSANSDEGFALSPLCVHRNLGEGAAFELNGVAQNVSLCFATDGNSYSWLWKNYLLASVITLSVFLIILNILLVIHDRVHRIALIDWFCSLKKYKFLIRQFVIRDFKTKYKRSVLGIFWSFLNPLLMMVVQYFVFSEIFKSDIVNYPVYLLIGITSFNFFSEAINTSLNSILSNSGLITKVYIPLYVFPLSKLLSAIINYGISLIPVFIACFITRIEFKPTAFLAFFFIFCLTVFSYGLGLMLAASMVFFRDTQFLWGVFSLIWIHATPIFYPESIIPQQYKFIHYANPLYYYVTGIRSCVMDGISPEPARYLLCLAISVGVLILGSFIFRKSQNKFIVYI